MINRFDPLVKQETSQLDLFYRRLTKTEDTKNNFPFRQIWKVNAPPSVIFFTWEAICTCIINRQDDEKGKGHGKLVLLM